MSGRNLRCSWGRCRGRTRRGQGRNRRGQRGRRETRPGGRPTQPAGKNNYTGKSVQKIGQNINGVTAVDSGPSWMIQSVRLWQVPGLYLAFTGTWVTTSSTLAAAFNYGLAWLFPEWIKAKSVFHLNSFLRPFITDLAANEGLWRWKDLLAKPPTSRSSWTQPGCNE